MLLPLSIGIISSKPGFRPQHHILTIHEFSNSQFHQKHRQKEAVVLSCEPWTLTHLLILLPVNITTKRVYDIEPGSVWYQTPVMSDRSSCTWARTSSSWCQLESCENEKSDHPERDSRNRRMKMFHHSIKVISPKNFVMICLDFSR